MCVKEFYGYNCGHCSVPILRQCPLSSSNPHYPVCKFPAERPIFTNEFCHPCSRVVWNAKVLKEEEEHRARHLRGECLCEVIFEGEDRQKRLCTRGGKGKGKGTGREIDQSEQQGDMGVVDHGAFELRTGEGEPGGCDGRDDVGEQDGMENNMALVKVEEDVDREGWETETQMAAYEYAGYYVDSGHNQVIDPEQSYAIAHGGYGQEGAGMKWYQHEQQYHQFSALSPPATSIDVLENAPRGPRASFRRASSLPTGNYGNPVYDHPGPVHQVAPVEAPVVLTQPVVVSSDMMRSEST